MTIDDPAATDPLTVGGRAFSSRLFLGTGKFPSNGSLAGAIAAGEAVRLARLARSDGFPPWVKLEVTPDPRYLLPDPVETLAAAEVLCAEGFVVLPYCPA